MRPSFYDWDVDSYARHRPTYPETLFASIAARCPRHRAVWDCAAGSGQASVGLKAHFQRVIATDLSFGQIRAAPSVSRLQRVVCNGLAAPFRGRRFDLVTVAQALHWFPHQEFFAEVARVASGGTLAAWNYGLFRVNPEIDAIMGNFYRTVVGPYWPPERRHIENDYAEITFPFGPTEIVATEMTRGWGHAEVQAYVGTWSAVRIYRSERDRDPLPLLGERLASAWGDGKRAITWPISVHICRVP